MGDGRCTFSRKTTVCNVVLIYNKNYIIIMIHDIFLKIILEEEIL